jgi:hypothetical protein
MSRFTNPARSVMKPVIAPSQLLLQAAMLEAGDAHRRNIRSHMIAKTRLKDIRAEQNLP